jgi:hypothetical protein
MNNPSFDRNKSLQSVFIIRVAISILENVNCNPTLLELADKRLRNLLYSRRMVAVASNHWEMSRKAPKFLASSSLVP